MRRAHEPPAHRDVEDRVARPRRILQVAPAPLEAAVADRLGDGPLAVREEPVEVAARDEVGRRDRLGVERRVAEVLVDVAADEGAQGVGRTRHHGGAVVEGADELEQPVGEPGCRRRRRPQVGEQRAQVPAQQRARALRPGDRRGGPAADAAGAQERLGAVRDEQVVLGVRVDGVGARRRPAREVARGQHRAAPVLLDDAAAGQQQRHLHPLGVARADHRARPRDPGGVRPQPVEREGPERMTRDAALERRVAARPDRERLEHPRRGVRPQVEALAGRNLPGVDDDAHLPAMQAIRPARARTPPAARVRCPA